MTVKREAVRALPFAAGMAAGFLALRLSGATGALWLVVGLFVGGWVPLYLMPWLRRRI